MRHNSRRPRVRVYSRVDRSRPLRQTAHVAGIELKRLAEGVITARERLRVTQEEFADLAGLSVSTVRRVEQEDLNSPRTKTFAGLDRGAGWVPGSARALFREGREPVLVKTDAKTKEEIREEVLRRLANIRKHYPVEYESLMRLVRLGEVTDDDVRTVLVESTPDDHAQ